MRWLALCLLAASPAVADAPLRSERPVARAGTEARNPAPAPVVQAPIAQAPVSATPVVRRGPDAETAVRRGPDAEDMAVLRPTVRPARRAAPAIPGGSVCGDPDLKGEFVGTVPGRLPKCGISDAVRLTSVSGIRLSQGSLVNCRTAAALKTWTERSVVPALARKEGGLTSLRVAAHYSCRTRNHRPGAPLSEHSFGNAIDISGFTLASGRTITVKDGWNARGDRAAMRAMFDGACGPFTTAIGPDGDRFHLDHFHFDVAQRRGNYRYCR
ncbi:MAG: extensin family protein [Pseudomonadota bacterium]